MEKKLMVNIGVVVLGAYVSYFFMFIFGLFLYFRTVIYSEF